MPELASSLAGSGNWGLSAAVAMPEAEALLLAEDVMGFGEPMPLAGEEVALMPGNSTLEWKRQGSIHEVAAAEKWVGEVSSRAAKQTELQGAVGQMGSEYGYLGLPQGCGAGLAEVTVQYWGEESGAVYEARTLAARQPRGPYDLSLGNRYFRRRRALRRYRGRKARWRSRGWRLDWWPCPFLRRPAPHRRYACGPTGK